MLYLNKNFYVTFSLIIILTQIKNISLNSYFNNFAIKDLSDTGTFIDFADYYYKYIFVTTSQKLFQTISVENQKTIDVKINKNSAGAGYDGSYIFLACLNDSLLSNINLNNGNSYSILSYSDININLKTPNYTCSCAFSSSYVYIAFSFTYDDEDPLIKNETISIIENNKLKNYIIKLKIKHNGDNGPIADNSEKIKFYHLDYELDISEKTVPLKQISCEVIANNQSLICGFLTYNETNIEKPYVINLVALKSNFSGIDQKYVLENSISSEEGFKLQRINESNIRLLLPNLSYIISIDKSGENIVFNVTGKDNNLNKYLYSFESDKDLFYYDHNTIFSCVHSSSNSFYLRIKKNLSNNVIQLFRYDEGIIINKIAGYLDENSNRFLIFIKTDKTIKYITLDINAYSDKIFKLNTTSITYELNSNYNTFTFYPTTLTSGLDITNGIFIYKTILNKSNGNFSYSLPEGCTYNSNNQTLTVKSYKYNWLYIKFAYQENITYYYNSYLWVILPEYFELYIKTCDYKCGNCTTNCTIFNSCRTGYASLENSKDNICYLNEQNIPNYFYNSNNNIFEKCYISCKFCSNSKDNLLNNHNCIYCEDNYFKSYEYIGNCYKNINTSSKIFAKNKEDEEFTVVNSCYETGKLYLINETKECVSQCPQSNFYVTVSENENINLTENTLKYIFFNESIPKYIFGNICYNKCPNGTETDKDNNFCKCLYAWHQNITTKEITCYEKEDYCIYDYYKYYLNDTKECIHEKCPNGYYIFNNICFKDNCPEKTILKSDNITCICSGYFTINNDTSICFDSEQTCESENFSITVLDNKECLNNMQECILKNYSIFNDNCYLNCPNNTELVNENNSCICSYFYYYENNNKLKCLDNNTNCKDEGFLITNMDTKECLNNTDNCVLKNLVIYDNKCYKNCPNNTFLKLNSNTCLCYNYLYFKNQIKCIDSYKTCINNNYPIISINNETCLISIINSINNSIDMSNEDCYEGYIKNFKELTSINNYICLLLIPIENDNDDNYDYILINKTLNEVKSYIEKNIIKKKDINSCKDVVLYSENFTYVVTTSTKQNKSENYSYIDLGDCEKLLKEKYNISENLPLIILLVDFNIDYKVGVQFELYDPIIKEKLNLSYCEYYKIIINSPIYLENATINLYNELIEQGYDLFNPNDSFYNDICTVFTTKNNTDILLSDRKKDYYNYSLQLCQENCTYEKYDSENKKVRCACQVNNGITGESDIKYQIISLKDNFFDFDSFSNVKILQCYKIVFSAKGLKKNLGSYLMLIILFVYIILITIFLINGVKKLKIILSNIFIIKKLPNPIKKYKSNYIRTNIKDNNNIKSKEAVSNPKGLIITKKIVHFKKKKNLHENKKYNVNIKVNNTIGNMPNNKINSKSELKCLSSDFSSYLPKNTKTGITKKTIKIKTDTELNRLKYEDALKFDHRKFIEYYWSLLKAKHIIIFTFINDKDYNLFTVKLNLFLFVFSLYFCINAFFFTDDTMHEIYSQKGNYNFIFGILGIIYSTIISIITTMIIKRLSLTENSILDIKEEKNKTNNIIITRIKDLIKCFKIRYFIFFSSSFALLFFFWYFLAAFCAIYPNTQYILLKDTLSSYALSLIYPFAVNLIPGFFRISAIKNKSKCKYKIGQILSII